MALDFGHIKKIMRDLDHKDPGDRSLDLDFFTNPELFEPEGIVVLKERARASRTSRSTSRST